MTENAPVRWPKISLITPCLNQVQFLEECLRSVLDQEYPNLEYLVLDGGSTDGSLEILQKYAGSLKLIQVDPESFDYVQGDSQARHAERNRSADVPSTNIAPDASLTLQHKLNQLLQIGLSQASGELVAWLHPDAFYYPGALQAAAQAYLDNPGAPFIYANGWRVDHKGRKKSRAFAETRFSFSRSALVYGLNYILQPATWINRQALDRAGSLDRSLVYVADLDLWIRLSELGEPVFLPDELAAVRQYGPARGGFDRLEELRLLTERYGGLPATPGYLSYYLDHLHEIVRRNPQAYPSEYLKELEQFWGATTRLMEIFGAQSNGLPFNQSKIGIELRNVTHGESGGISFLFEGVLEALFRLYPENEYFVFGTIFNQNLTPLAENIHRYTLTTDQYYEEMGEILHREKVSVLLRSYPTAEKLKFPLRRQIVFIPDIQHEVFPEFFSPQMLEARQKAFQQVMAYAAAIGTLTEFSRRTILEHPDNRCRDVFLMPPALTRAPGSESGSEALSEAENALLPTGRYFYYPANLWPHKNHRRVLQAFELFLKKATPENNYEFIFTGHPDGWEALQSEFASLPVRHLGFVRPAMLQRLYQGATALVDFSLYEGFGMPLLEAFEAGAPVICSNNTSLPEVGGQAVLTCDPLDVPAMSECMLQISHDESLRTRLVEAGRGRLANYSWEASAQALMEAIRRVSNPDLATRKMDSSLLDQPGEDLPLVTIVTPSYNQGRFLRRAIESILNQTYPNIEYMVMDGGSKDESVEVLKSYGDRFPWVSERDKGQTDAVKKGFARGHGEILAFVNSDDELLPHAVETVVRYFQEHPEVDMVYGKAYYTDEDNRIIGMYNTDDYSFTRLVWDNPVCQPAAFWRKRIADKIGEWNADLHYAMDHEYWMRIDRAGGKIVHIPDVLAISRLHDETKTSTAREKIVKEVFLVSQKWAGYVSLSYFQSLWHDRVWNQPKNPYRLLRVLPGSYLLAAKIHEAVYHKRWPVSLRPGRLLRSITYPFRRYLLDNLDFLRPWIRKRRASQVLVSRDLPLYGYYRNNWLGPVFQVYLKRAYPGQPYFLNGEAATEMLIQVRVDRKTIQTLQAAGKQSLQIEIPAQAGQVVSIEFSQAVKNRDGLMLSFEIQGTNLFTEGDTTAG